MSAPKPKEFKNRGVYGKQGIRNSPGKFYAVCRGKNPGIYTSWDECQKQVKGFQGNLYKSFKSFIEAEAFLINPCSPAKSEILSPTDVQAEGIGSHKKRKCAEKPLSNPTTSDCLLRECIFQLEFDGASKGNPGQSGGGAVLKEPNGNPVLSVRVGTGVSTNNVAEYRGLIEGLRAAREHRVDKITVLGDSKLVCMQVQDKWKVSAEHLAPLCEEAKRLAAEFQTFVIKNVPRALNSTADAIANQAIELQENQVEVVMAEEGKAFMTSGSTALEIFPVSRKSSVGKQNRRRRVTKTQTVGVVKKSRRVLRNELLCANSSAPIAVSPCQSGGEVAPQLLGVGHWKPFEWNSRCCLGMISHHTKSLNQGRLSNSISFKGSMFKFQESRPLLPGPCLPFRTTKVRLHSFGLIHAYAACCYSAHNKAWHSASLYTTALRLCRNVFVGALRFC